MTNVHRMCTGKIRYGSRESARRGSRRIGIEMRPYDCPFCEGFHLTSKPPKDVAAMLANQEALEAVRPLLAAGLPASEIASRTGLAVSKVYRIVAAARRLAV